jgi:hypothetical protein
VSRTASPGKVTQVSLTPEQISCKRAFREIVRGVGGLEAAEGFCRVKKTSLARYYDETCDDFAPIDVVADLEPLARNRPGWPHLLHHRANQMGFMLLELPQAKAPDCNALRAELRDAMEKSNRLHIAMMEALADGKVTCDEADGLIPIALEVAEQNARIHALLKRIAEEC